MKIVYSFMARRHAQIAAQRAFEVQLTEPENLALEPKESEMTLSERIQADLRRLVAEGIVYGHADFTRNDLESPQVDKDNDKPVA